jgi:hypothetical protein
MKCHLWIHFTNDFILTFHHDVPMKVIAKDGVARATINQELNK